MSDDGEYVYFAGDEVVNRARDIFVHHDGRTRFIARMTDFTSAVGYPNSAITPDGRYLAFQTASVDLAGRPTTTTGRGCDAYPYGGTPPESWPDGECIQTYRYDAESGRLDCVSCSPFGRRPTSHSDFWQGIAGAQGGYRRRSITADGRVFFHTATRLLPQQDTNDRDDVYEWNEKDGLRLVSPGSGDFIATFGEVSEDGRSVFFFTDEPLVGQDVDRQTDLYVARVGGGIPAQNPPLPPTPCAGETCKGDRSSPPGPPEIGSIDHRGPGNETGGEAPPRRAVQVAARASARGPVARLSVRTPSAGTIRVAGTAVRSIRRQVPRAGAHRVTVALDAAARRRLRRHGRLVAAVRVSFAPRSGRRSAASVKVTFRRAAVRRATGKAGETR